MLETSLPAGLENDVDALTRLGRHTVPAVAEALPLAKINALASCCLAVRKVYKGFIAGVSTIFEVPCFACGLKALKS